MEIILAKNAGFCFGVKRATQLAFAAAERGEPTFTLGPIIHSPQVVQKLQDLGVEVIETPEQLTEGVVIIRSHGITAQELAAVMERELEVVDATCPFVKKAQEHVRLLFEAGYSVVVVGDREHPEVQGIVSYAPGEVHVVGSGEEAATLPRLVKVGIVAQTTQSFATLRDVVDQCLQRSSEVRVFNTICDATAVRQDEARELARQVDCMVVIGGYNSANTRRLAELCREIQPCTHHIENAEEITGDWFAGVTRVGVTAGASTPKWLIDEVVSRLREFGGTLRPAQ